MSEPTFYKVLDRHRRSIHGGKGYQYPYRRWTPQIDDLVACAQGYHLVTAEHLLEWVKPGCVVWEAEHGDILRGIKNARFAEDGETPDKWVTDRVRLIRMTGWNDRTVRLFAADCAERVAHLAGEWEPVCRDTIAVVRRFVNGEATRSDLEAAREAAWAAEAAWASEAAVQAAWASGAAAWAAAWAAGAAAGKAAERAARASAGAAAEQAARAAGAAERAARASAGAAAQAAWEAAWAGEAAEREWQTARLVEYLERKA